MFKDIVFVAAKRTPFGTFGGKLKDVSATDLGVLASSAALKQAGLSPMQVDHVVFGTVIAHSAVDGIYGARHIGLRAGVPFGVPALNVNRLCGSGFEAVVQGAVQLQMGHSKAVLVGGTENMSQAPHVVRGARWGIDLGKGKLEDSLWESLSDTYAGCAMGITAENLAKQYSISQGEVDEFSAGSQHKYQAAKQAGLFDNELFAVTVGQGKRQVTVTEDEHPRGETSVEGFAKLPKIFDKRGVLHAGACSGICDGAAALVMTTLPYAQANGLTPLARFTDFGVAGCDPTIMGIGPVPAIQQLMDKTGGKDVDEYDLVEINEAFAPQTLAFAKALGVSLTKLNTAGGAIAVGHPLGASGARITAHLVARLAGDKSLKRVVGSACIGGGQGIAVGLEAV